MGQRKRQIYSLSISFMVEETKKTYKVLVTFDQETSQTVTHTVDSTVELDEATAAPLVEAGTVELVIEETLTAEDTAG